jgi:hypothetical protein
MPIESHVTDPRTGQIAWIDDNGGSEDQALIVSTRELKTYTLANEFFTSTSYGADMNQNVSFGGTAASIHDGTDGTQWTAAALSGTWDFASTDQAQDGSKSVDATATVNNNEAQFVAAASVDSASYAALTGYVYFSDWDDRGTKDVELYWRDTVGGCTVGDIVGLRDYVNVETIGAWQSFAIATTDTGWSGCVNALRVRTVDIGPGTPPDYYLDDLELQQTGCPIAFTVKPDQATWLHVQNLRIVAADNVTGVVSNGTMPGLSYNKLLGETALTNGLTYQRIQDGEVTFSRTIHHISDFLQFPRSEIDNAISDGTNTMITIDISPPQEEILKSENDDQLRALVQDDLSGLLLLRMSISGRTEQR